MSRILLPHTPSTILFLQVGVLLARVGPRVFGSWTRKWVVFVPFSRRLCISGEPLVGGAKQQRHRFESPATAMAVATKQIRIKPASRFRPASRHLHSIINSKREFRNGPHGSLPLNKIRFRSVGAAASTMSLRRQGRTARYRFVKHRFMFFVRLTIQCRPLCTFI